MQWMKSLNLSLASLRVLARGGRRRQARGREPGKWISDSSTEVGISASRYGQDTQREVLTSIHSSSKLSHSERVIPLLIVILSSSGGHSLE